MEIRPAFIVPNAEWVRGRDLPFWYLMRKREDGLRGEYLMRSGTYVYKVFCLEEPSEKTLNQMRVQEIKYLMGEEPWR